MNIKKFDAVVNVFSSSQLLACLRRASEKNSNIAITIGIKKGSNLEQALNKRA